MAITQMVQVPHYYGSPRFPLKGSLKGDIGIDIDADIVPHY